jgi:formyltetrahydrofolate deformylase
MKNTAILLINCPDRKGIVFTIARFLYEHGANIIHADQHRDDALGLFFLRVEWALEDFDLDELSFREKFVPVALQFSMSWKIKYCNKTPVIAIFVSNYLHCLVDLLHRHQTGELKCEIGLIISNHQSATSLAEYYTIPFYYLPVTAEIEPEVEIQQLELLAASLGRFNCAGSLYAGGLGRLRDEISGADY